MLDSLHRKMQRETGPHTMPPPPGHAPIRREELSMPEIPLAMPRAALQRLIDYAWKDERKHYGEMLFEDGIEIDSDDELVRHARANAESDHIFTAIVAVADWLHATGERSAYEGH
jgi:hypothetical protein